VRWLYVCKENYYVRSPRDIEGIFISFHTPSFFFWTGRAQRSHIGRLFGGDPYLSFTSGPLRPF